MCIVAGETVFGVGNAVAGVGTQTLQVVAGCAEAGPLHQQKVGQCRTVGIMAEAALAGSHRPVKVNGQTLLSLGMAASAKFLLGGKQL
jgi:hypothetical protein